MAKKPSSPLPFIILLLVATPVLIYYMAVPDYVRKDLWRAIDSWMGKEPPPKATPKAVAPGKMKTPKAAEKPTPASPVGRTRKKKRRRPGRGKVALEVSSRPGGARLYLGGTRLGKAPYKGRLRRGNRRFVAFLPGHHPDIRHLIFDRDPEMALRAEIQPLPRKMTPWGLFRGDPGRTGFSSETGDPKRMLQVWTARLEGEILASPVQMDGKVYISTDELYLACLDGATGNILWRIPGVGNTKATAALYKRFAIVGSSSGVLMGIRLDKGKVAWKEALDVAVDASPLILGNRLVVGDYAGRLHAWTLRRSGKKLKSSWKMEVGGAIRASPAGAGDRVFVATDKKLFGIDAVSGRKLFQRPLARGKSSSESGVRTVGTRFLGSTPAVLGKIVVAGTISGEVKAFRTDGNELWTASLRSPVYASPALAYRSAYVGTQSGLLVCLDLESGSVLWKRKLGSSAFSSPLVADGAVYVGTDAGLFYVLDAFDGSVIVKKKIGAPVRSSPSLSSGLLVVGASDGQLHAYRF